MFVWNYFKPVLWGSFGPPTGCKFEVKFFVSAILWLKNNLRMGFPSSQPSLKAISLPPLGLECVGFYFLLGLTSLFLLIVGVFFYILNLRWGWDLAFSPFFHHNKDNFKVAVTDEQSQGTRSCFTHFSLVFWLLIIYIYI